MTDLNKDTEQKIQAKKEERKAGRPKEVHPDVKKDLDLEALTVAANLDHMTPKESTNVSSKTESKPEKALSAQEMTDLRNKKKAARKAVMRDRDVLALDPDFVKPGKRYRLTNVTPGNIEKMRSRGYEIVKDPIHKGEEGLGSAKSASGSVEVEVGKRQSSKAVWMETDEENYQILRELEDEAASEQESQLERNQVRDESGRLMSLTGNLSGGIKKD